MLELFDRDVTINCEPVENLFKYVTIQIAWDPKQIAIAFTKTRPPLVTVAMSDKLSIPLSIRALPGEIMNNFWKNGMLILDRCRHKMACMVTLAVRGAHAWPK